MNYELCSWLNDDDDDDDDSRLNEKCVTYSRGFLVVCRQIWMKISSRSSTTPQPFMITSNIMQDSGTSRPIFRSPMYVWISLNTSAASFFTSLFSVLIIGFWIISCLNHQNTATIKVKYCHTRYQTSGPELILVLKQSAHRWKWIDLFWIICKNVKFSHTCYQALGPELIPVHKQSARRWLFKSSLAVACYYFLPGLQSPSQPKNITVLRPVPSYTAWWQRHISA